MDERPVHPLIESLKERRERHRQRGKPYRIVFMLAGATVTLGGLALLVLPGPAFLVIPIGLAMLALEFAWAERLLEHAVERAEAAKQSAVEASHKQKAAGAAAVVLGIAAAVAAAIIWDIPLLPV